MAASISGSVGSYESGAKNNTNDIKTVQQLLTSASQKKGKPSYHPGTIDGKISRTASRSATVKAIGEFQKYACGMSRPDFRIDVNGKTWRTLIGSAGPITRTPPNTQRPVTGQITLTVSHGDKIPTVTNGLTSTVSTKYESTLTFSGGITGTFTGSIYPDDMNVKGRVVDGSYPLHIGFHKGGGGAKQPASALVHKTDGIRPGLLVNARNSVPVTSNKSSKTTSVGINVHNGFNTKRYSDGCITLQPSDWKRFIEKILGAYPDINDWHTIGNNTGKRIGTLIIRK